MLSRPSSPKIPSIGLRLLHLKGDQGNWFTTVDVFALSNKSPITGGNQVEPFWSWVKEKAKGSSEVPPPAGAMLLSQLWGRFVMVLGDEGIGKSL